MKNLKELEKKYAELGREIDPNASIICGNVKRLEEQLEKLVENLNTKEKLKN